MATRRGRYLDTKHPKHKQTWDLVQDEAADTTGQSLRSIKAETAPKDKIQRVNARHDDRAVSATFLSSSETIIVDDHVWTSKLEQSRKGDSS